MRTKCEGVHYLYLNSREPSCGKTCNAMMAALVTDLLPCFLPRPLTLDFYFVTLLAAMLAVASPSAHAHDETRGNLNMGVSATASSRLDCHQGLLSEVGSFEG